MNKILITPRSYGKTDMSVLDQLKAAGFEPVMNPYGQILTKEQMKKEVADCVGIILGVDPCDAEVLACAPHLKAIAKYGVGTDNIDKEYCEAHGIKVSITRAANANAVADMAFTLICACARKITFINDQCHEKDWTKVMGLDIYGKKIGILGLGAIGKGVAKRAKGFDMDVMAYDVFWDEEFAKAHDIKFAEPAEIFKECDFVSLHLPLTQETEKIVNKESIATMKPNAILVNTARGGLIDDDALLTALAEKKIAAAGLDVFNEEPPADERFYQLDNIILGSHAAASTNGASETMSRMATENVIRDAK